MTTRRREFLAALLAATAGSAVHGKGADRPAKTAAPSPPAPAPIGRATRAVLVASANGLPHLEAAHALLAAGGDTLEAAISVCTALENDPNDESVGYGGLPNEDGEVELDASVMHGPTRRAGAVAGVRRIRNVARLAKTVMERTDHLLLVGDGARRFAVAQGFAEENLLTDRARRTWLLWKEGMSRRDSWGPGLTDPGWSPPASGPEKSQALAPEPWAALAESLGIPLADRASAIRNVLAPPTGTVHCSVLSAGGELSGATSTSGLAWKIAGRVGDSPIVGAGCFTDPDVGSAGATGRGEENIKIAGAHTIVENMRRGMSPAEAGLDALRRIVRNYGGDRERLRYVSMTFYALRRDGAFAGTALWSETSPGQARKFAIHDGTPRLEPVVSLFEGAPVDWPPAPKLPTAPLSS